MQLANADDISQAKTLEALLDKSFMQPWLQKKLYVLDPLGRMEKICDFAVLMGKQLLLIMDKHIEETNVKHDAKQAIKKSQQAAIYDAHHALVQTIDSLHDTEVTVFSDPETQEPFQIPEGMETLLLCVTNMKIAHQGKLLTLKHDYGSAYFQEDCVLDFDDTQRAPQIFSFLNFVKLVNSLDTFADFTDFLNYHKQKLVSGSAFENEINLLKEYIASAAVFHTARQVDDELVQKKLRPSKAVSLQKTTVKKHVENFKSIKNSSQFWKQIISVFAQQIPAAELKKPSPYRDLLAALMSESIYSRYTLVGCINDFMRAPPAHRREGYMVHMRSYTNPKRHYAFLFYAQDEKHEHHRSQAQSKLQNVAAGINYHEQKPHLDEIIIIGLLANDMQFKTDMYYMQGSKIDVQLHNHPSSINDNAQYAINTPAVQQQAQKPAKTLANREARKTSGIKKLAINQGVANVQANTQASSRNAMCPCGSGKKFRHCHGAANKYGVKSYL